MAHDLHQHYKCECLGFDTDRGSEVQKALWAVLHEYEVSKAFHGEIQKNLTAGFESPLPGLMICRH
jgi:hypothetical protein